LQSWENDVIFPQQDRPMSDFKFACPVCGQHITCDSGSSGTQMDCPTCFRKLVVPQAPAAGSKNFVLTAAEVQMRAIPLPGNGQTAPTAIAPKKFSAGALTLGVLLVVGSAAAVLVVVKQGESFRLKPEDKVLDAAPGTNARPALALPARAVTATNWTLNLAEVKIPDAPANGTVHGFDFKLERAVIQGGKLDLRQGPKWPPEVGLTIHLFADRAEDLAGKIVTLEATRTNAPRVILRWKDDRDQPVTKDFRKGYAARLEFGSVTGNRLDGKIYLATPDAAQSYAAGTFSAEIRKPTPPKK